MSSRIKLLTFFGFLCIARSAQAVPIQTEILENTCNGDRSLRFTETTGNTSLSSHALVSSRTFFVGRNRSCRILMVAKPRPGQRLKLDNSFSRGRGIILSGKPNVSYSMSGNMINPSGGNTAFTTYNIAKPVFVNRKYTNTRFAPCGTPVVIEIIHRTNSSDAGSFDMRVENFSVTTLGQSC